MACGKTTVRPCLEHAPFLLSQNFVSFLFFSGFLFHHISFHKPVFVGQNSSENLIYNWRLEFAGQIQIMSKIHRENARLDVCVCVCVDMRINMNG